MSPIEVLKFGSSVLRFPGDLHVAIDEIYRRWRSGYRVLAVVSAFEGVTDALLAQVIGALGPDCSEAAAAYLATGESQTAALLHGELRRHGLPSRIVDPREIGLRSAGTPLESMPVAVDLGILETLWNSAPILVLPGFFGIDSDGTIALFGRGGSDLSALFIAATLRAACRLLKDVPGVFDTDPARSASARRFIALSWERAIEVSGPLIQPKALHYARSQSLSFEVGRPNEAAGTLIGHTQDEWERSPDAPAEPLRIALVGCGSVGRGVYEALKRHAHRFEVRHVVVRHVAHHPDIPEAGADHSVAVSDDVDIVVVCLGDDELAHSLIAAALGAGKFVVTANKAALASHGGDLLRHAQRSTGGSDDASDGGRRLWYSAAVGGALPALETLERLTSPIREIRGILNGTCGVVLDAWARGSTRERAVALAQRLGFAEKDPSRDLSGRDSANKLALLIQKGFQEWIDPAEIPTLGIDTLRDDPAGYRLIARATRTVGGIAARVAPERLPRGEFLAEACGPENRLEIELAGGETFRLRAQGAGRWPTTVSVMGDLLEISRLEPLKLRDAAIRSLNPSTRARTTPSAEPADPS